MINNPIGWDTETVKKGVGGYGYSMQFVGKDISIFQAVPSLNPVLFRNTFFKIVNEITEDGDFLVNYNLGGFDLPVLFRDVLHLFKQDKVHLRLGIRTWRLEGVFREPTPFFDVYFDNGKRITFVDGAKYFGGEGTRLETVAKSFTRIKKYKYPIYLGKRIPTRKELPYFKKYSMRDAQICYELGLIIKKWHEVGKQKNLKYSLAHLMGSYFNQEFCYGKKLDFPGNHIDACAGWAKFGGLLASHVDSGLYKKMAHLDIHSAYGWAGASMKAYFGGAYFSSSKLESEGIYKISTILPKDETRPLFLRRMRKGKRTWIEFQPLNQQISFWTTEPEISVYKKIHKNWKYEIISGYVWKGSDRYKPLKQWNEKFFKLKEELKGNKKMKWLREFYKGAITHLTGKFDANIRLNPEDWFGLKGEEERGKVKPGMLRNYFVASILRAKVRAYLYYWGVRLGSVQEVTDSLDIPLCNLSKIKLSKKMGGFGLECTGDLIFIRQKAYLYFDSKLRNKAKPLKLALHGVQIEKNYKRLLKLITHKNWDKVDRKMSIEEMKKLGLSYTRKVMNRVKGSLRTDGGKSALSFKDKDFKSPVFTKKLREEVKKWLR